MIYNTPEETPGYKGLHGEVVECDIYKIKELDFVPDVIFDLGANIGVFTRFAREVFPDALIVAVEPDKDNFEMLSKFTRDECNTIFINKAIGIGQIWHGKHAANGSGEVYLSTGLGYPEKLMPLDDRMELSDVQCIMPYDLYKEYVKEGDKVLWKIDVEGAENFIFTHGPSWDVIKQGEFITMELHHFARTGAEQPEVNEVTKNTLDGLKATHRTHQEHVQFYAWKNK